MRRFLLLAALAALCLEARLPTATAGDEPAGTHVPLPNPTVLASPGCPEALHAHLPGSGAPDPWRWPLPDGPLLLLGLPDEDPLAQDLGLAWGLLPPGGDLAGGYVRCAWHDGRRPIAVILAGDATALRVAGRELEATETGLRVQKAWHFERPRFRVRAAYAQHRSAADALVPVAIAGRGNELWIRGTRNVRRDTGDLLPRLRRQGIVPVVVVDVSNDHPLPAHVGLWHQDGKIRHFALRPRRGCGEAHLEAAAHEIRALGGVERIVVLYPELRAPQAWGQWSPRAPGGKPGDPPLVFAEWWADWQRTPAPCWPHGRPPGIDDRCVGLVAASGPSLKEVLLDAWTSSAEKRAPWAAVLLPLLPGTDAGPRAFLEVAADRLEHQATHAQNAAPWLGPLAKRIRGDLWLLDDPGVLVPRVPASIRKDGRLDEPAWAWATRLPVTRPDGVELEILALSDGRELSVAVRGPRSLAQLDLQVRDHDERWGSWVSTRIDEEEPRARGVWRRTAHGVTWEGGFGPSALGGDAHPTRVFTLWIRDPERPGLRRRLATLVLGP